MGIIDPSIAMIMIQEKSPSPEKPKRLHWKTGVRARESGANVDQEDEKKKEEGPICLEYQGCIEPWLVFSSLYSNLGVALVID